MFCCNSFTSCEEVLLPSSKPLLKKVVYTCICSNYEKPILHSYIRDDWDYICFTDDETLLQTGHSQWMIRPLQFQALDGTRNNRWHKMFPHKILNEYDISLYVDGNIDIIAPNVFDYIDSELLDKEKELLAVNKHPKRTCIYDEAITCKKYKKDQDSLIDTQMQIFRELNYPIKNGLKENNMIYRIHHNDKVKAIMEEWWWWVSNYSKRDQLSFDYVLWKYNFKVHVFKEKYVRNPKYAKILPHDNK